MSSTHASKLLSLMVLGVLLASSLSPATSWLFPLPVAAVEPPPYSVKIEIGDPISDIIYFADHTDDLADGNWLELSGGTEVSLPSVEANYDGVEDASFDVGGTPVDITTTYVGGEKTVTYPLDTHQVYLDGDDVVADFYGEDDLGDWADVSFRLIGATTSEWKDAYTDLLTEADATALKTIIQDPVDEVVQDLVDGDASDLTFADVPAGDYILVALVEDPSDPYSLVILSATPVEVLDFELDVDHDDSVTEGDDLDIDLTMTDADAADYIYGAVMIRSSVYDLVVELTTDGSIANTDVTVNGEVVVEGEGTIAADPAFNIIGFDLDNLNTGDLTELLADIFGENYMAVAFTDAIDDTSETVSINTDEDMHTGEYVLLMGVWDTSNGNKLVAFAQDTVEVAAVSGGGGGDVPTPEEIEDETPEDAAAILEDLDPSDAADIIDELSTADAVAIIEEMNADSASDVLLEADPEVAAQILEDVTTEEATAIVEAAIDNGDIEDFVEILIDMQDKGAAEILADIGTDYGAAIVEEMATRDLNEAAKTVEEAVKLFTKELDPATKKLVMDHMRDTLKDVTVETLVSLFIEIANLPATPSTVAEVFEILELSQVMDIVTGMGAAGAWSELGKVFDYLTTATLTDIYTAMTEGQRTSISPFLTAATVVRLPKLYTFTVSDLVVTPASVKVGESVTVSVKVTNAGTAAGSYDVVLKVNSVTEQTKTVSLNAGASTNVSFTVTKSTAGTYSVAVGAATGSFTVKTPAAFAVSNLQISATEVEVGKDVTVTVTVGNTGELSGSYTLSVKLDGVEKYSEAITVEGKSSTTKTYTLSSTATGQHTVTVDGLSVQFTVKTTTIPPPTTPDYTWYIVGGVVIIVVLAAVYFFYIKKKSP